MEDFIKKVKELDERIRNLEKRSGVGDDLTVNSLTANSITSGDITVNNSLFFGSGGVLIGDQGGSIELGDSLASGSSPYIDFHYGKGASEDYNVRLINDADKVLSLSGNLRVLGELEVNKGSAGVIAKFRGGDKYIGIGNQYLGGSATFEILTEDDLGNLTTRAIYRGGSQYPDIEFYTGRKGSEQLVLFLRGNGQKVGIGTSALSNSATRMIIPAGSVIAYKEDWPSGWGGGLATWDIVCASIKYSGLVSRSDKALKRNITEKIDYKKLLKLKPIKFKWKDKKLTKKWQYGFLAQDVKKVYPELVSGEKGNLGINYERFIPLIVGLLKEMNKEIKELKLKVKKLENGKINKRGN